MENSRKKKEQKRVKKDMKKREKQKYRKYIIDVLKKNLIDDFNLIIMII